MGNTVGRQFFISQTQREVINGCLLGDGRLESRSITGSARLRIHQGWRQKELVFWKYKILKNLVSAPPRKIVCWKNPRNNEDYFSWYFHTLTLEELREFYQKFYKDGEKRLPQRNTEVLTPLSLAVWVMDDGCYDGDSIILNTQNLSLSENKTLQKVFKKRFDLISGINKDRDEWRLRFKKQSVPKLQGLIRPYIIPSMRYKIVPVTTP